MPFNTLLSMTPFWWLSVTASLLGFIASLLLQAYQRSFPNAGELWLRESVHFPPYDEDGSTVAGDRATQGTRKLRRRCSSRFACTKYFARTGPGGITARTVGVHLAFDFSSAHATRVPLVGAPEETNSVKLPALELRHEWLQRGQRPLTDMKVRLLGYTSAAAAHADMIDAESF